MAVVAPRVGKHAKNSRGWAEKADIIAACKNRSRMGKDILVSAVVSPVKSRVRVPSAAWESEIIPPLNRTRPLLSGRAMESKPAW